MFILCKYLFVFVFVFSIKNLVKSQENTFCPHNCTCESYLNKGSLVYCSKTGKTRMPVLPNEAIVVQLSHNDINEVSRERLRWLKNLRSLDLSHNSIQKFDVKSLNDQKELKFLDLSYNNINNFTIDFIGDAAKFIQVLNLSSTNLFTFPSIKISDDLSMDNLKTLVLKDNFIKSIPANQIPTSLEQLDLSCNDFRHFQLDGYRYLPNLKSLSLQGCNHKRNKISSISRTTFSKLPKLKYLDLSHNRITGIPYDLSKSIESINLRSNEISRLKQGECASDADIQDDFYRKTSSFESPDTESTIVGSELSSLINLRFLDLSRNKLQYLCQDDFIYMDNLVFLNLSNNQIKRYGRHTFPYARSLQVIDLSKNLLTRLVFPDSQDLTEFYVQKNLIREVEEFDLRKRRELKKADFSDNDFTCDCHIDTFWKFLMFAHDIEIPHLEATTTRYNCSRPEIVAGKSLMAMRSKSLTCDSHATKFDLPIWAIAAPASLFLFVTMIVVFIVVGRRTRGEAVCGSCCEEEIEHDQEIDLISPKRRMNGAAVFCHDLNYKLVMNSMIQKIEKHRKNLASSTKEQMMSLKIDVFTIGESIKVEALHSCIETYRKLVLVVTHEFLHRDTCLYVLNVISDHISSTSREAVLVVIMDNLRWDDLPQDLKLILTEKTFLEFPKNSRLVENFWENLCVQLNNISEMDEEEEIKVKEEMEILEVMSPARAARLKRLGIKANGEVDTGIQEAVQKARMAAKESLYEKRSMDSKKSTRSVSINEKPTTKEFVAMETRAPKQLHGDSLNHDIVEEVISTSEANVIPLQEDPFIQDLRYDRNLHSLLPADCEDAESVYSKSSDTMPPAYRPGGRHQQRPLPVTPIEASVSSAERNFKRQMSLQRRASINGSSNHGFQHDSDIENNLHGVALSQAPPIPPRNLNQSKILPENDDVIENPENEAASAPIQKKKGTLNRLRSYFK